MLGTANPSEVSQAYRGGVSAVEARARVNQNNQCTAIETTSETLDLGLLVTLWWSMLGVLLR